MAKIYVNGQWMDEPKPTTSGKSGPKKINKPAGPKVKARGTKPVSAKPSGNVTYDGKRSAKLSQRGPGTPPKNAPRGFSRGGYGGAPKYAPGVGALEALGGGLGVMAAGDIAYAMTPEGYGPKAGYGNEQSPRDFNTYQGALPMLGTAGAATEKFAGDVGQVVGELSTFLPEGMGGVKTQAPLYIQNPDGSYSPNPAAGTASTAELSPEQWQEMKDEQYMGMFGQDQEGYGYLASGSEPMPLGPGPAPSPAAPDDNQVPDPRGDGSFGMTPDDSPVDVKNGTVIPRYGMPEAPTMRSYGERLYDVMGETMPDSMEAFMVANFMQNKLLGDDKRSMDQYKSELNAMPQYMQQDYMRQALPSLIEQRLSGSELSRTQAKLAPGEAESQQISRALQGGLANAQTQQIMQNMNMYDQFLNGTPEQKAAAKTALGLDKNKGQDYNLEALKLAQKEIEKKMEVNFEDLEPEEREQLLAQYFWRNRAYMGGTALPPAGE